jgi:hypothetical protein
MIGSRVDSLSGVGLYRVCLGWRVVWNTSNPQVPRSGNRGMNQRASSAAWRKHGCVAAAGSDRAREGSVPRLTL